MLLRNDPVLQNTTHIFLLVYKQCIIYSVLHINTNKLLSDPVVCALKDLFPKTMFTFLTTQTSLQHSRVGVLIVLFYLVQLLALGLLVPHFPRSTQPFFQL